MSRNSELRVYSSKTIAVTYDAKRCIHAAECVHGLPSVFDTEKRPWIQPNAASADEVAKVVRQCPTGALKFERVHGGLSEQIPEKNIVQLVPNGPLYIHGDVEIRLDGEPVHEMRVALCRCGASKNKPFCDNGHKRIEFEADGLVNDNRSDVPDAENNGTLDVGLATNGPYLLQGDFEILSDDEQSVYRGSKAALCRCGGSRNRPFCDGTHRKIGFTDD